MQKSPRSTIMPTANTSIDQIKYIPSIKQTIVEQNGNNKKGLKEYRPSETSDAL